MSIGRSLPRPDGRDKVTGRALYAADYVADDMLHGVLVGAAIPAGRVAGIRMDAALAAPGIINVITHAEMPRLESAPSPPLASVFLPMQDDEIRYQGQPVALVLGETLEAAERGAELVEIDYDPSPFSAETNGLDLAGARPPSAETPYAFGTPVAFEKGDPDAALAGAAVRLEAIYVQPSRHHNAMETSATLARWDGDRLTVYDAVQAGFTVQAALAAAFGLDPRQVRVISHHTGGGFGGKGFVWPHELIAAAAARVAGRPVRIQLTRAQQYAMVGYQARTVQKMTLAADAEGRLAALCHDSVNLTGMSDDFIEIATEAGRSIYAAGAIRTISKVMARHVNLPTPMRAPVEGVGLWAVEGAMNELAHKVGIDPLDLRLLNYAETDPASGRPWSSKKLREAYEEGARLFGWRERPKAPVRDGRWLVGHGMATCSMGCFRNPWQVRLSVRDDGSALVEAGYHDIGTGTLTIIPQIAADALGIEAGAVETRMGDTDLPQAGPTYGSSSTMGAGGAILDAADKLRQKLAGLANLPADETELRAGGIARRGGPVQPIGAVLRHAGLTDLSADGAWAPSGQNSYAMRTFGAIFVEVGVDPKLGLLRLRRAVGSYSAGRIVNPRTARSQMIGGIIWGWGKAAMEESRHEPTLGRWLAKNLSNLAIPVNADIPSDITIHFVDEFDRHASPIGAKGIGELGATGVDAAIAEAVFQAMGKRIRSLPITPDKLV